jgi:hypothetical protein
MRKIVVALLLLLCEHSVSGQNISTTWITESTVTPFTKAELGFNLPDFAAGEVERFFREGKGLNPFDPDQVNAVAQVTNGQISYNVPAFYYEEYTRDRASIRAVFLSCPEAKWDKQTTAYKWRVRFAPPAQGTWYLQISVRLPSVNDVEYTSAKVALNCNGNADNKGFLEIGTDKRHFRYSGTKESFFMMGQDIAWPDGSRFRGGEYPEYPRLAAGGYLDIHDWARNLAANGGNTIRVVNVPWSYELEWDTVGVYRMERAWELDQLFSVCESSGVKVIFCLEHGTYGIPPQNEEHLDWRKHPYNKFIDGVDTPDDFLRNSSAHQAYRNKLRYFLARWGYSTSLGVLQLLSEMEHWSYDHGELKGNSQGQDLQWAWHTQMLLFAKEQVKYRTLLTSTSYGAPPRDYNFNAFSSPAVDVICPRHCYFTSQLVFTLRKRCCGFVPG